MAQTFCDIDLDIFTAKRQISVAEPPSNFFGALLLLLKRDGVMARASDGLSGLRGRTPVFY